MRALALARRGERHQRSPNFFAQRRSQANPVRPPILRLTFLMPPNSGRLARVKSLERWRGRGTTRDGAGPRRPRVRLWSTAVGAGALAVCLLGEAAVAAELSVTGPDACPDASELAFRVERSIGVPLALSAPLRFDIVFEAPASAKGRYSARLHARRLDGPDAAPARVIDAGDCGRLGDAVSVAIALALRSPEPASGSSDALPRSSTATTVSPATAASAARALDQSPSRSPRADEPGATPALSAFVLADSGSLPRAGAGVGLGAELHSAQLAFRAQGILLFEQHAALRSGASAPGADLSLMLGSASACWSPFGGFGASLAAFGCAGWELGRLGAEGTGVEVALRGAQLWTAPRLDVGLSWALAGRWLQGTVQLSALAPLKRDDFFLRDVGAVHRPPGAVGRLTIGVDVAFE